MRITPIKLTQNVATAFRKLLQNESGPQVVVERALQALEGAALQTNDEFGAREIINTLHIMAKTRYLALVPKLEGRAEALAGTFNAQGVANTLWACATMGREPGAGLMRELGARAEAVAGTFNAQEVANTLWAVCLFSIFCTHQEGSRWVHTVAQRLVSLDKPGCLNTAQLYQLHQFCVWCGVEPRLGEEEINDMQSLKEACRSTFEGAKPAQSATQK